ncbi:MAG: fimbria/pilus outer membrane usher protein [Gammaproteobacteria bacterium]|nr:fimbria/pilus outer membrane usher protein [Gammaproteobacteria bacterium]
MTGKSVAGVMLAMCLAGAFQELYAEEVERLSVLPLPKVKPLPTPLPLPKFSVDPSTSSGTRPGDERGANTPNGVSPANTSAPGEERSQVLRSFRTYVAPDRNVQVQNAPVTDIQETNAMLVLDDLEPNSIGVQTNTPFTQVFFNAAELLAILKPVLLEDVFKDVRARFKARRWIGVSEMRQLKFIVETNPANYSVRIVTPARYRVHQKRQVNARLAMEQSIDLWPAANSASLSAYWEQLRLDKAIARDELLLEGHWAHKNWVLEHDHRYDFLKQEDARRATTLTADFAEKYTRFSLGDIGFRGIGMMGSAPLLGMTLGTQLSMQPNLIFNPITYQPIFLENASTVKVYVNNAMYRQLMLPGGYYDLLDFPLINGTSNVTIEATDIKGRTRVYNYQGYNDIRILAEGVRDFGITAGVPRYNSADGSILYLKDHPMFSGFLRQGYTPYVTLAGGAEGSRDYMAVVGSVTALGAAGTLETNASAGSAWQKAALRDFAVSTNYLYSKPTTAFSISMRYMSEYYRSLGQGPRTSQTKYFVSSLYSFPKFLGVRPVLRAQYSEGWNGLSDTFFSMRMDSAVTANLFLGVEVSSYAVVGARVPRNGITLSMAWTPWKYGGTHSAYNSLGHEKRQAINFNSGGDVGVAANVSVADSDASRSLVANSLLNARSFEYSYSGTEAQDVQSRLRSRFERQTLSSGLAYAGGSLAWGRALHKSPYIIVKNVSATDEPILVGRGSSQDKFLALSGGSTQLFSGLGSYSASPIFAKVEDPQAAYRLDHAITNVFSTYRSGAFLPLRGDMAVFGLGALHDAEGAPLALVMAHAVRVSDGFSVDFFTDETGRFQIEGLRTGHFRIAVDGVPGDAQFDVAPTKAQSVELGVIKYVAK